MKSVKETQMTPGTRGFAARTVSIQPTEDMISIGTYELIPERNHLCVRTAIRNSLRATT